jgi:hypothetical protein
MKLERSKRPIQFFAATLPWRQLPDHPDIGSWKCNLDGSPAFIGAADTGNDVSNAAILLHEFVEAFLCWLHGVAEEEVTRFDQAWFKEEEGPVGHLSEEPGDDVMAPYHKEHLTAELFEREFIEQCGMSWEEHEKNCDNAEE